MLPLLLCLTCLVLAGVAQARTAQVRIQRVTTAVAVLEDVQVRLDWPAGAAEGQLRLSAGTVAAENLGYRFADLLWQCPLQRDGQGGWRCDGTLRSGRGAPLRLSVDLATASTDAVLSQAGGSLALHRSAATPDDTGIDLTRVPLVWAQALLAQAWPEAQLKAGTLDGQLRVHTPDSRPLQVVGKLAVVGASLDTPDASIAAEGLSGAFDIDYRKAAQHASVGVDGSLRGGEILAGNAYIALPATPVALQIDARQSGDGGWQLPRIAWRDGDVLRADGSAGFGDGANLQALDLQLHSGDVAPLRARYLSGWLGLFGLGELEMRGAFDARLRMVDGQLIAAQANLHDIGLNDGQQRFRFDGLGGDLRFSGTTPVSGELRWRGGQLYGLDFGAAALPTDSRDGVLRLRDSVTVPAFGGSLHFEDLELRPPQAGGGGSGHGLRMQFALGVDKLDIGRIAKALGWPAFQGELSGRIAKARYEAERLVFDGGLAVQLFGGQVLVSSLSLERPFGVAPSLNADVVLEDLDLEALTGVFDFGSITGVLDGHISDLRLVDWTATAFDAELHTDPTQARQRGLKQRISQRAVQNISSVGDASFINSLQGRLIGFFDDFGYRRIGISCRLASEVCIMGGLHPAKPAGRLQFGFAPQASVQSGSPQGFTIVEGAGIPQLTVVGFNRQVDWPTLLERLAAVGKGEVKPVVQ